MADIYFRVDGNSIISTGHVMRCLSIARACKNLRRNNSCEGGIYFLVSDEESEALVTERMCDKDDFEIINLKSRYDCLEVETDKYENIVKNPESRPWIFVDSYFATPQYFESLRKFFKVAYLDDLREFPCDVDLLINYDTEKDCDYYAGAVTKLLGPEYTPLREQFVDVTYTVKREVGDILISTGGTDPYGVALKLTERLVNGEVGSSFTYHILAGRSNRYYEELVALANNNPQVCIHEGVQDMASLMASCDLAVSAGGVTLCELAAVGVPSVSFSMADNQMIAVENFDKRELIPYCGDVRGDGFESAENTTDVTDTFDTTDAIGRMVSQLLELAGDYSLRMEKSAMLRAYIDGQGAAKIAAKIVYVV